jgi:hypothetical protein
MKVYVKASRNLSRAMFRVANALRTFAPKGIEVVSSPEDADLHVLHVIGLEAITYKSPAKHIAVIQYCLGSASPSSDLSTWWPLWRRAAAVWTYYDLADRIPADVNFYHAPLGIDEEFLRVSGQPMDQRRNGVLTCGFVTGPGAEAIEEMACAARAVRINVNHLGPVPVGLKKSLSKSLWRSVYGISDAQLADLYGRTRWVSGLRFVEGFELPVLEGLSCGARPIVFDRPDMRQWYEGHAVFVPECSGEPLIELLTAILSQPAKPVSAEEQSAIRERFRWEHIIKNFWAVVANRVEVNV